jgi:hypothetical protein
LEAGRGLLRQVQSVDAHGSGDVLQALLSGIDKVGRDFALNLPPSVLGNRDSARLGDAFDPRRDVDAVAKDVSALDDDIANVDADPKLDWSRFNATGIVLPEMAQLTASTALRTHPPP